MIQTRTQDGYPITIPTTFYGYTVNRYIGCGSTCSVFLIEDTNKNELYAAKVIPKDDIKNKKMETSILTEVQLLQAIDHPNIIKVEDFFTFQNSNNEEYYIIVMEYCQNGDLLSYATKNGFNNESEKKEIIKGFLQAVDFLHQNGISHGDIKSENILLDENFQPKLCDFGFCRFNQTAGDDSKSGTLYYAAPELFQPGEFDALKTDIYAIGVTVYSLSELQFPFLQGDNNFIVQQILNGILFFRNGIDFKLKRLVQKCTAMNPKNRPTIKEIINDEYFDVDDDDIDCQKDQENQIFGAYQLTKFY